ncbi:hypothetical protein CVT26_002231 [Gymnopilus dilepis]|uniref:Uncharacterized protein n=1 Tax=Gymnopilus dilepis TaxID=231916 RepID=A0A409VBK2_9AGAR|nr:hypothetical protein CVT26_002231 [Gymnopilus dilepis]
MGNTRRPSSQLTHGSEALEQRTKSPAVKYAAHEAGDSGLAHAGSSARQCLEAHYTDEDDISGVIQPLERPGRNP